MSGLKLVTFYCSATTRKHRNEKWDTKPTTCDHDTIRESGK